MTDNFTSPYLDLLRDRIDLQGVPFTDRGSRLVVFSTRNHLFVRLAERWYKKDPNLSAYRTRLPILIY